MYPKAKVLSNVIPSFTRRTLLKRVWLFQAGPGLVLLAMAASAMFFLPVLPPPPEGKLELPTPPGPQNLSHVAVSCPVPEHPNLLQATDLDKTLSPFFFIPGGDSQADLLPLKSTVVDAQIAGVIAGVTVQQVYRNEGRHPIEAVYIFPGSTHAAVQAMKMTIGARIIEAKIREREQARQEYQRARSEGRSASLLEQQRPNVFQMSVANIMPGDTITVELQYSELLVPEDGKYQFVYPTVVGPRYSNKPSATAAAQDRWVANPYFHEGQPPSSTFDITVKLAAGLPLQDISCATHPVVVSFSGPATATVRLDPQEQTGGNRDYILSYRLTGSQIQSGLLLYPGQDENFFLLTVQPPARLAKSDIPRREYIFIVDVSGSMSGFPLDISKKLLSDLIHGLRSKDTFNILLFSGGNAVLAEHSLNATEANIQKGIDFIDRQEGGGGTELLPALRHALALPRMEGCSRIVVVATDGYVDVEKESFAVIRANLGQANLFAFGIGSSVNRYIIEGMARAGMGEPFVVENPDRAPEVAVRFYRYISRPALTQISLEFNQFQAYDVEPASVPDVMSERPVMVFGKWRGTPTGVITMHGLAGEPVVLHVPVDKTRPDPDLGALRYLWARHRIAALADDQQLQPDDGKVKAVTALGLKYHLLTEYTSFVAVDTQVRNPGGRQDKATQPLPLPQGVSDLAVGDAGGSHSKNYYPPQNICNALSAPQSLSGGSGIASTEGAPMCCCLPPSLPSMVAPSEPVQISGGVLSSKLIKKVEPAYPSLAKTARLEGTVLLHIQAGEDGRVSQVKVLRGHPLLAAAAVKAVKQWVYSPTLINGDAVPVNGMITIKFTLSESTDMVGANPSQPSAAQDLEIVLQVAMFTWHFPRSGGAGTVRATAVLTEAEGTTKVDLPAIDIQGKLVSAPVKAQLLNCLHGLPSACPLLRQALREGPVTLKLTLRVSASGAVTGADSQLLPTPPNQPTIQ